MCVPTTCILAIDHQEAHIAQAGLAQGIHHCSVVAAGDGEATSSQRQKMRQNSRVHMVTYNS
jgi:hypothetical protein